MAKSNKASKSSKSLKGTPVVAWADAKARIAAGKPGATVNVVHQGGTFWRITGTVGNKATTLDVVVKFFPGLLGAVAKACNAAGLKMDGPINRPVKEEGSYEAFTGPKAAANLKAEAKFNAKAEKKVRKARAQKTFDELTNFGATNLEEGRKAKAAILAGQEAEDAYFAPKGSPMVDLPSQEQIDAIATKQDKELGATKELFTLAMTPSEAKALFALLQESGEFLNPDLHFLVERFGDRLEAYLAD